MKRITIEIPEKVAHVICLTLIGTIGTTTNVSTGCVNIVEHNGDTLVTTGDDNPNYWRDGDNNG